jgi:hypothetical protein
MTFVWLAAMYRQVTKGSTSIMDHFAAYVRGAAGIA